MSTRTIIRRSASARTGDVDASLLGEPVDPAWMLLRQLQLGELAGEHASHPLDAKVTLRILPIGAAGPAGEAEAISRSVGLAEGPPIDLRTRMHLGRLFEQTLGLDAGQEKALRRDARLALPDADAGPANERTRRLGRALRQTVVDGVRIWQQPRAEIQRLVNELTGRNRTAIGAAWDAIDQRAAELCLPRDPAASAPSAPPGWQPATLTRAVELKANGARLEGASRGGPLEWWQLAVTQRPPGGETRTFTARPTRVQYRGQPALRFWSADTAAADYGALEADETDLFQQIALSFFLTGADDAFVVPIELPAGVVAVVDEVEITGSMDGADTTVLRPHPLDPHLFGLTGAAEGRGLIYTTTRPVGALESAPIEVVRLQRDELNNLVWGLEDVLVDALGQGLDGAGSRRGQDGERRPVEAVDSAGPFVYHALPATPDPGIPYVPVVDSGRGGTPARAAERTEMAPVLARRATVDGREARARVLVEAELLDPRALAEPALRIARRFATARDEAGRLRAWIDRRVERGPRQQVTQGGFDTLDLT